MGEFLLQLLSIAHSVVLPILLIALTGFLLQRKVGLDMATLTRLTFYYILPAVMFSSLLDSEIAARDVASIVIFTALSMLVTGLLAWGAALLARVASRDRVTVIMGAAIQNAGNYGLTIQRLAFEAAGKAEAATSLYSFYMVTQNVLTFTAGIALASAGVKGASRGRTVREAARQVLSLPPLYAVAAGVLVLAIRGRLGPVGDAIGRALAPAWQAVTLVRGAFVGLAVASLGAQLATLSFERLDRAALLASILRLGLGPACGYALIRLFGLHGLPAQVLFVGSANPTAVNVMLLCLQFRDDADSAARMVLYTTLASPVTVTLAIFAARAGLVG